MSKTEGHYKSIIWVHVPLARYVKLQVADAPGMSGTFSPVTAGKPSRHPSRHVRNAGAVMHAGRFLLSRWRGKRSRHSRRMRNPQFYVSGKRSITKNSQPKQRKAEQNEVHVLWDILCQTLSDITITSQIMGNSTVCSTVYSWCIKENTKAHVTGLCEGIH